MSIRTDYVMDWTTSPRTITFDSPSVLLTIQDLIDTLRDLEYKVDSMGYDYLVDSAGKIQIASGEYSIISLTLNNLKVGFEARGSWTECEITGGTLVAVDSNGDPMSPIHTTAYVNVSYSKAATGALLDPDILTWIKKMVYNDAYKSGDIVTIKEDDGATDWESFDLAGGGRVKQ